MSRSARQRARQPEPSAAPPRLSPSLRLVLSLLFAAHLLGVFVAPLGMSVMAAYGLFPEKAPLPPEGQQLAEDQPPPLESQRPPMPWLNQVYQPYLDALYLNHGYGFFAPDPGVSHLIDYTIELKDGSQVKGRFPDLAEHWPRLRYHRHFMLAEQIVAGAPEAYARHLLKSHDARRVRLERIEHVPASPEEVKNGMKLDDPSTYRSEGAVIVEADREGFIEEPAPPAELIPRTEPAP